MDAPFSQLENKLKELRALSDSHKIDLTEEIKSLEEKITGLKQNLAEKITPSKVVQVARHLGRPTSLDFIQHIFTEFTEFHGDRNFGDDPAMVTGAAFFNTRPVFLIAQQKGKDTAMNIFRNFGMPHPEGYRKALRIMRLAEKFHRPIFVFIDTPGAYPGIEAEERGQAEAIARNIRDMSQIKTPIIATVIGEGGSGGALAIGVADRILMFEFSIFSVISPEGCSSILFRSADQAARAAEALKLTASDLLGLKVIDEIIPEPPGGAHNDPAGVVAPLKQALERHLDALEKIPVDAVVEQRYQKFRRIGVFLE